LHNCGKTAPRQRDDCSLPVCLGIAARSPTSMINCPFRGDKDS